MGPPWLAGFDPSGLSACLDLPQSDLLAWLTQQARHRSLVTGQGQPLSFVLQDCLPEGEAYEAFIGRTGCVPMRDNHHDRFNALVWLHLPKTKAQLNRLQALAISAAGGVGPVRGSLRDWATLLDENGLVLVAPESGPGSARALADWLDAHDWPALFQAGARHWTADWRVFPLGHACLEKLQHPFKAITAHAWVVTATLGEGGPRWEAVDQALAARLAETPEPIAANEECACHESPGLPRLRPLPVMGIPGWSPDQTLSDFYQDSGVFRPARSQRASPLARPGL